MGRVIWLYGGRFIIFICNGYDFKRICVKGMWIFSSAQENIGEYVFLKLLSNHYYLTELHHSELQEMN